METKEGQVWKLIRENFRATILLEDWTHEAWKEDLHERGILKKLKF